MANCIITGDEITPENDSAAHVIPSALGGRLKPKGFLSALGNQILNDKVDAPLIRSLGPFMTLLGGSRDRGDNAPLIMKSGDTTYVVSFGGPIQLARPEYRERVEGEATVIEVRARTMKEVRQLLGRVKAKHASFDVESALAMAAEQSVYLPEMLGTRVNVGPNPVFPAVFAMANVYAAWLGMPLHSDFVTYIHQLPDRVKYEPEGQEVKVDMPPNTFYWLPPTPPYSRPPSVSHAVIYFGDPSRKKAIFYAELFNLPGVAVVLPYDGSDVLEKTYAVDVVTAMEQHLVLDRQAYREPWECTHETPELFDIVQQSVGRILELATQRMREHEIERIISDVVGNAPVFTEQHIGEISTRVAELAARLMIGPAGRDNT